MHTFRSPKKILLRHANNDDIKRAQDFYTLHGKDELLLCLERGYNGITRDKFPCSTFVRIVGSCYRTFFLKINNNLSLWNPSIRHKLSVPKCPQKPDELETFPWAGIGLGFDPIGDDYKIVWISESRKSSFVYAVKTGAWCEIASPTPQFSYVLPKAVFFNGVLHWEIHCDHIKSQDIYLPSYILTFDLSTHVFGMIRLPEPDWCWRTTGLTTIQSSLALISYRMDVDDTWIRVWRDNSWYVVFKLGTYQLPIEGALQLKPQPNINDGDLLLKTFEEGVQVYNPKTRL
ncbi:unnamed protein product [Lactuca saligna]|uniref:F-box associated beta-propeller type 3 domain-containing protein n=1 Tax=Lactuca saligna TaxID=75948 RepID=A0AA36EGS6_LACSI|nr:unnamed protein product [Lactuca saligna]